MQRRWEEQLAGYVAASFRVISLGNTASQAVQFINKLVTAAMLYFGAKLVIDGDLTVGELVAFNMLAGRVSAPVLRLAQIWQDFHQARLSVAAARRHPQHPGRADLQSGPHGAPGDPRRRHLRARHLPLPHRRAGSSARRQLRPCRPARSSASSARRARARARSPSSFSASMCRRAAGCWSMASILRSRSGLAAPADRRRAAGERAVQPLGARQHRARRSGHADRARHRRSKARRRPRLHSRTARRLRHDRRRARQQPVRRPAPAHRDRPRADHRSAHPDLR